jgi:hypothetical protein
MENFSEILWVILRSLWKTALAIEWKVSLPSIVSVLISILSAPSCMRHPPWQTGTMPSGNTRGCWQYRYQYRDNRWQGHFPFYGKGSLSSVPITYRLMYATGVHQKEQHTSKELSHLRIGSTETVRIQVVNQSAWTKLVMQLYSQSKMERGKSMLYKRVLTI